MRGRRILVTGGAGFIGRRLVRSLMTKNPDDELWILDNLHPQVHGPAATPPVFPPGVHFVRGDVADQEAVNKAMHQARPELVYHLAAETGTGQSYDEPTRYCLVNVIGTTHLIEAIRAVGSVRRVVLAASRAVYGEGGYRDSTGRAFVGLSRTKEDMRKGNYAVPLAPEARLPAIPIPSHAGIPPAPASVYASTKLMQEYLFSQAGNSADWQATLLRFQNVYGPGQSIRNPYTGVLSIFARQLLEGKQLEIFEDGQIARDFVFVDDVVDSLVRAGERKVPHGTVLDIGSGKATTILAAAQQLMVALGRDQTSFRITGEFRVGDVRYACADIRAATTALGWIPRVSVDEGLRQLADWAQREYQLEIP